MKPTVRVRFAPSPTGHLHIGNARTAILNWIFARKHQGVFVLRIEDSDRERSTASAEPAILEDLQWLGLNWDEGPQVGGDHGPYHQSQRLHLYAEYLNVLRTQGNAYPCYCKEEELEAKRQVALQRGENPRYDQKCLSLSTDEIRSFEKEGRKPVWRFRARRGEVKWEDLLKGEISFDGESFGDFVVVRPDGAPVYNFAAVVDDGLMKITHVIRGDDHVSNTPKQILIHEAFGWPLPQFCHIPMILGPDRTRLSKRHGATSMAELRIKGYLPKALINFLSLLSWSAESGDEVLPLERIIAEFDTKRMSKSPALFDPLKLNWMNGIYIRDMAIDELVQAALPFLQDSSLDTSHEFQLQKALELTRGGIETLSQFPEALEPFFRQQVQLTDGEASEIASRDSSQKIYWAFLRLLQNYDSMDSATFRMIMKQLQKETGIMGNELWVPIRVALMGRVHGPDLPASAEILGKQKCERFVRSLVY
ncbi:MAG TPA: glutamate--tRNA ligase [bacterium]